MALSLLGCLHCWPETAQHSSELAKAGGIPFVTSAYVRVLEFASSPSLL